MTHSLHTEPHPDQESDWKAFKQMGRGSRQAAEDAAIDAYLDACEKGLSKEECGRIHGETYRKHLYGK